MSLSACDGKTSNGAPETIITTDSATSGTESVVETVSVTEPVTTDSGATTVDSNDSETNTTVVANESDMDTAVTTIVIDPTTGKPMECVDNDGDGWGWTGLNSCRTDGGTSNGNSGDTDSDSSGGDESDSNTSVQAGACIDNDGDGWGWNGVSSCLISNETDNSSTADGGISDNAGSATSDGGISDNAGSATSDGSISDNAGSGTSDGGGSSQGNRNTNAGSYSSSNVGGSVIRQSSLGSIGQSEVCTLANNPNDFSDIRVGDFILHNNAWRTFRAAPGYPWEQCVYTDRNGAFAGWNYDWGPGIAGLNGNPRPSGDFYVRSYPEIIFGTKDEFRTSAAESVTGLPVRVRDMPSFQIDYSYDGPQYGESRTVDASNNSRFPNGTTISGERNVAIESFFYAPDGAGNCSANSIRRLGSSNHTYEVMVWLDAGAERLPAGPTDYVADLTIRGSLYKVYTKGSDPRYIAFVAQNPQTSGTLVWNDFTDWARENAHRVREQFGANNNSVQIQDDWCMGNIIVGTEIFWGAGNVDFYNWTITQSR